MMVINLSIQVTLEKVPRDLRLWWPGVPGTLERYVQQSTQNFLAEMLDTGPAPSMKRSCHWAGSMGDVDPLVFHIAWTIWY